MSFFKQQKPRPFHHEYMYVNERKERLRKIEEQAKKELGLSDKETFKTEDLKGAFYEATPRTSRRRQQLNSGIGIANIGLLLIILLILLVVMKFLM